MKHIILIAAIALIVYFLLSIAAPEQREKLSGFVKTHYKFAILLIVSLYLVVGFSVYFLSFSIF